MKPATYLAIKNFREHQHYHDDRAVVWIKLYTALLDDYEFLALPEPHQAQLVKLWLLAARMKNRIPNDVTFIKSKIGARGKLCLTDLIASGWLVDALEEVEEVSRENLEQTRKLSSPRALAREEERRGEKKRGEKKAHGAPRALDKHDTWLTPLATAHEAIYGAGTFRALAGEFARFWRPLIDAHGGAKCAEVWRFSQDCTDRERPFRTPKYVASHFADFDPKAPGFPEVA